MRHTTVFIEVPEVFWPFGTPRTKNVESSISKKILTFWFVTVLVPESLQKVIQDLSSAVIISLRFISQNEAFRVYGRLWLIVKIVTIKVTPSVIGFDRKLFGQDVINIRPHICSFKLMKTQRLMSCPYILFRLSKQVYFIVSFAGITCKPIRPWQRMIGVWYFVIYN